MSFEMVSIRKMIVTVIKDVSLCRGAVESKTGDHRDAVFTPQRSTMFSKTSNSGVEMAYLLENDVAA